MDPLAKTTIVYLNDACHGLAYQIFPIAQRQGDGRTEPLTTQMRKLRPREGQGHSDPASPGIRKLSKYLNELTRPAVAKQVQHTPEQLLKEDSEWEGATHLPGIQSQTCSQVTVSPPLSWVHSRLPSSLFLLFTPHFLPSVFDSGDTSLVELSDIGQPVSLSGPCLLC